MVYAYLDYNATAPVWPEVVDAVADTMKLGGNASSVHSSGRRANCLVEEAREKIAELVNAKPCQIIFTSGGTEANNLALCQAKSGFVIVSAIEHDSILKCHPGPKLINVCSNGIVLADNMKRLLTECIDGSVVSVMLANNETGVLQPIQNVGTIAREWGVLVHCDAIQAAGKVDVDWPAMGVHMMSLSAHKLGGPQGVGALIIDDEIDFRPMLKGGGQERGHRAGTENVAGIVGFGVAAELVRGNRGQMDRTAHLRSALEDGLRLIVPEINIHGSNVDRLPNTSCISMPGVEAELQVMALDLDGFMVSAGSACSSGKVTTSHVLTAMGVVKTDASSTIRVSLGWNSNAEDVETFLSAWQALYARTRNEKQIRAAAA